MQALLVLRMELKVMADAYIALNQVVENMLATVMMI